MHAVLLFTFFYHNNDYILYIINYFNKNYSCNLIRVFVNVLDVTRGWFTNACMLDVCG